MKTGDIVAIHDLHGGALSKTYVRGQIVTDDGRYWRTACDRLYNKSTGYAVDGNSAIVPWSDAERKTIAATRQALTYQPCHHVDLHSVYTEEDFARQPELAKLTLGYNCPRCSAGPFFVFTGTHVSPWRWREARHFARACCLYTVIVMLTLLGIAIAISGIMRHTS